jgi:hypothetical protein
MRSVYKSKIVKGKMSTMDIRKKEVLTDLKKLMEG